MDQNDPFFLQAIRILKGLDGPNSYRVDWAGLFMIQSIQITVSPVVLRVTAGVPIFSSSTVPRGRIAESKKKKKRANRGRFPIRRRIRRILSASGGLAGTGG